MPQGGVRHSELPPERQKVLETLLGSEEVLVLLCARGERRERSSIPRSGIC